MEDNKSIPKRLKESTERLRKSRIDSNERFKEILNRINTQRKSSNKTSK